jgi:hypothetical protein
MVSKALRRLEQRGLVLRQSQRRGTLGKARVTAGDAHTRTTHVQLTAVGIAVAARLRFARCVNGCPSCSQPVRVKEEVGAFGGEDLRD